MPRINIELETELHKKTKLNSILQDKTLIQYIPFLNSCACLLSCCNES